MKNPAIPLFALLALLALPALADDDPAILAVTGQAMPKSGSFHRTRAIRLSAASVPSQTMTRPACCE